jgi:hypothetical protein
MAMKRIKPKKQSKLTMIQVTREAQQLVSAHANTHGFKCWQVASKVIETVLGNEKEFKR